MAEVEKFGMWFYKFIQEVLMNTSGHHFFHNTCILRFALSPN